MAMFNTASAFEGLGKASLKLDFETETQLKDFARRYIVDEGDETPDNDPDPEKAAKAIINNLYRRTTGDAYMKPHKGGVDGPGDVYIITDTRSKAKKELDEIKALKRYDVKKLDKEALRDVENSDPLLFEQIKNDLGAAGDIYVVRDLRTRTRKEPGNLVSNKNLHFIRIPAESLKNFNRKIWDLQKGDYILSDLKKEGYISIHLHFEENQDKYFVNIPFYVPYKKEKYDVPTLAGRWRDVPVEVDIKKVYNIAPAQHPNTYLTDYERRQDNGEYTDYIKRNDFYGVITPDYYEELRKKAYQQLKKEILESNSRYITDYQKKLFTDFYKDPKKFKIRLLNYYNDKESHAVNDNERDEYIGFEGSKADPYLYNNPEILQTGGLQPTYTILPSYDRFFAPAENRNSFAGFGLDDTKELIADTCRKHYKECAKIAAHLKADTLLQSCFNLWHWLHHNIKYEYDRDGREEVRSPLRVWQDRRRGVDCDCLSVFAWCVLKCMGYNPAFELVAFNNKKAFSHIFINCDGVVVDRVWFIFNQRPPLVTKREIYKVNLTNNLGDLF